MHKKSSNATKKSTRKCDKIKKDILFDNLRQFKALTENQKLAYDGYKQGTNLCITGYAGTGKTYIALSLALEELESLEKYRIAIYRSSVASRDIGFLPGTEAEKMEVYEKPYTCIINQLLGRDDAYGILKTKRQVTFESTSFLRGITLDNTIVIVDEAQNMDDGEINTLMTRLGKNSKVIICGDIRQNDLAFNKSGLGFLKKVLTKMPNYFTMVDMQQDDIVRSGFVKQWIIAVEEMRKHDEQHK